MNGLLGGVFQTRMSIGKVGGKGNQIFLFGQHQFNGKNLKWNHTTSFSEVKISQDTNIALINKMKHLQNLGKCIPNEIKDQTNTVKYELFQKKEEQTEASEKRASGLRWIRFILNAGKNKLCISALSIYECLLGYLSQNNLYKSMLFN